MQLLLDIPLQTVVIGIGGLVSTILFGVCSYLLMRAIKQADVQREQHEGRLVIHHGEINSIKATIDQHQIILEKHSGVIQMLLNKMTSLEATCIEQNKTIMEKLDHISNKLEGYDSNIRDFYQKYDLPLKK